MGAKWSMQSDNTSSQESVLRKHCCVYRLPVIVVVRTAIAAGIMAMAGLPSTKITT